MSRRSSLSKQAANEMNKAEETRTSLSAEADDIVKESEPVSDAETVALKPKAKNIAPQQSWWARLKDWLARPIRWLSVRPMVWLVLIVSLSLIYIAPIYLWQRGHQIDVQYAMQTTTAQALQTIMPTMTQTPTPTPIP